MRLRAVPTCFAAHRTHGLCLVGFAVQRTHELVDVNEDDGVVAGGCRLKVGRKPERAKRRTCGPAAET